jgi:hypothetical protein
VRTCVRTGCCPSSASPSSPSGGRRGCAGGGEPSCRRRRVPRGGAVVGGRPWGAGGVRGDGTCRTHECGRQATRAATPDDTCEERATYRLLPERLLLGARSQRGRGHALGLVEAGREGPVLDLRGHGGVLRRRGGDGLSDDCLRLPGEERGTWGRQRTCFSLYLGPISMSTKCCHDTHVPAAVRAGSPPRARSAA